MLIGSLFSGIGGLELGLERAGVGTVAWQCEIDPYARAVLVKHWPDAIRFEDVTKMHDVPPVDVICGGFPCQDISNAGRREGIHASRSGLFFELMRCVRVVRPRYVVLENVAAILARGVGDVFGELAESGFDAEWDCVPASAVGADHERDRWFAIANSVRDRRDWWTDEQEPQSECQDSSNSCATDSQAYDSGIGCGTRRSRGTASLPQERDSAWPVKRSSWWDTEPALERVVYGVPAAVDRVRCLGNAVVPQVAEVVGRRLMEIATC